MSRGDGERKAKRFGYRKPRPQGILPLDDLERLYILAVVEKCGGNRKAASEVLDIGYRTLTLRLTRYAHEDEVREMVLMRALSPAEVALMAATAGAA